jgi:hypothetical protein
MGQYVSSCMGNSSISPDNHNKRGSWNTHLGKTALAEFLEIEVGYPVASRKKVLERGIVASRENVLEMVVDSREGGG